MLGTPGSTNRDDKYIDPNQIHLQGPLNGNNGQQAKNNNESLFMLSQIDRFDKDNGNSESFQNESVEHMIGKQGRFNP